MELVKALNLNNLAILIGIKPASFKLKGKKIGNCLCKIRFKDKIIFGCRVANDSKFDISSDTSVIYGKGFLFDCIDLLIEKNQSFITAIKINKNRLVIRWSAEQSDA